MNTEQILTVLGDQDIQIPLILDSPHSGYIFPKDFNFIANIKDVRFAEDSYVDELYDFENIKQVGGAAIKAEFPRTYIDPNRASDDFCLEDIQDFQGKQNIISTPSQKSKLGIGLIWLRVPPHGGPMYNQKIKIEDIQHRIDNYYSPYHHSLQKILQKSYDKFGMFFHINCHSMQNKASAMSTQQKGTIRPDFVIGDKEGKSCNQDFRDEIVNYLKNLNYIVSVNDPYKGQILVSAYSNPSLNKNSIQIEINRNLYMDEQTRIKHNGFPILQKNLKGLLLHLRKWIISKKLKSQKM